MPKPTVTLRSLAKEAGVSPMTVSLALKKSNEISAKTGDRIRALAEKRGYKPDPTMRKLMYHLKTRTETRFKATICALIAEDTTHPVVLDTYPNRIRIGMKERAEQLGYATDLLNLNDFPTKDQINRVLINRGIEGLVILPLRYISDLSDRISWDQFSTVVVTSALQAPKFHSALPNHFDNVTKSINQIIELGYTKIGFVTLKDWGRRTLHRWEGGIAWHNCFRELPQIKIFSETLTNPTDYGNLIDWLSKNQFEVIIAEPLTQVPFQEILNHIPAQKRPQIITMSWPTPLAVAGVDQLPELVGKAAIEILDGLIVRGEKGIPQVAYATMIEGQWVKADLKEISSKKNTTKTSNNRRVT